VDALACSQNSVSIPHTVGGLGGHISVPLV
jgi:hypothetical protein